MEYCSSCGKQHENKNRYGKRLRKCTRCLESSKKTNAKRQKKASEIINGEKFCDRCGTNKEVNQFNIVTLGRRKGLLHRICKICEEKKKACSEKGIKIFKEFHHQMKQKFVGTPCSCGCKELLKFKTMEFDHIRGEKLANVSDYKWFKKQPGDGFHLYVKEFDKCQPVSHECHLKLTKSRQQGNLSQTTNAILYRKKKELQDDEKWNYIETKQNWMCVCGDFGLKPSCGRRIQRGDCVDFCHDLRKGEKKFNYSKAHHYSKKNRDIELMKGGFCYHECHIELTALESQTNLRRFLIETKIQTGNFPCIILDLK